MQPPVRPALQVAWYWARVASSSQAGGVPSGRFKNRHIRWKSLAASKLSASGRIKKFMYALAACCAGLVCSSRRKVPGCGELMMARRCICCGNWLAVFQATAPPQSCATRQASGALGDSMAISAVMSCTRCLGR